MYLKSLACVNACMGVTVVGVVSGSPVLPVLHLQSVLPLNLAPNHHSLLLFFYACRDLLESLLNSYLYTRLTHPHSACFCFTIYSVWSFQYCSSALVKELFSWLFSTLPKCHSACVPASIIILRFHFVKCVPLFNFHPHLSLQGNFDTSDLFRLGQCDAEDQFIVQDQKKR